PVAEEVQPTASLWEDFIDIFFAPAQVFARRPEGRFGIALLVLAITSALVAFGTQIALGDAILGDMQRAIENAPGGAESPAENRAQMRSFSTVTAVIGALIAVPVSVFGAALVVWLLGKFVNSAAGY